MSFIINPYAFGATYDPASITDTEFYFEADFQALADNDPFTQLTDRSANSAHATQGTSGNRATNKTSIINGLPIARFDGSSDHYVLTLPSMSEFTMSAIKLATGTGVGIHGSDGTNDYWLSSTGDFDTMRLDGVDAAVATDASVFELHTWTFSAGSLKYYRNGTLTNTFSRTMTAFQPAFFAAYNGSSDFLGGDVALAQIVSRDITGTELTDFFDYALAKYGL